MNTEKTFPSIKSMLEDWLSKPEHKVCYGNIFYAKDMVTWLNILRGTPGKNYIIFNNGAGAPFEIWRDESEDGKLVKAFIDDPDRRCYVFAYCLDSVETILRNVPNY